MIPIAPVLIERLEEMSKDMLSCGEMMDNAYIRLKGAELEAVTRALKKSHITTANQKKSK